VAGDDRVVAVGGELVEDAEVRRVRDGEPDVGARVGGAGDPRQVVERQVRVVDPGERDRGAGDVQPAEAVGQVEPACSVEALLEVGPRELAPRRVALAGVGEHVAERVAHRRHPVVVGAEHVDAGDVEEATERVGHDRHGPAVPEVVARVDDQVGLEGGEAAQPLLLGALVRRHVDVTEVEHLQRRVVRGEKRHRHPAQGVLPRLPGGVRRQPRPGQRTQGQRAPENGEEGHSDRLPQWAA
jgi:hypothetical protein